MSFKLQLKWMYSVPLGALVRLLGQGVYILISSWITNENLLALLLSNAHVLMVCLALQFDTWILYNVASVPTPASWIALSSVVVKENHYDVTTLQDNMSAWMGTSGAPSYSSVAITLVSMLAVNSLFYVFMMHILYAIMLKSMGYPTQPLPKILQRFQ